MRTARSLLSGRSVSFRDPIFTIIIGTGEGHLSTKIDRYAGHLTIYLNTRGLPEGMLATGIDRHIYVEYRDHFLPA